MPETKLCKYCQSEIGKKAKICPICKRKQGGKLKYVLIVLAVFFVIGFLVNLNNNGKDTQNTSGDATSTIKPTSKDAKSKEKASNNKAKSKKDDQKLIAFGKEGKSDDLSLKVNKAKTTKKITENEYFEYKPDSGKYAIVNVTIKNNGKEAASLTNGYFKLVTSDGTEFEPTILIGLSNKYISFESINPKLDITGNLVFEVPLDLNLSDVTMKFSGTGLFTEDTNFSLK